MDEKQKYSFSKTLYESILPFWERSRDDKFGGYLIDIDEKGNVCKNANKHLTGIARMIYAFSVGYRLTRKGHYRELAREGVVFLSEHFHDQEHGGFFLLTDRSGNTLDAQKSPYAHAAAVYALAEYYRCDDSQKDTSILQLAEEVIQLIMHHAYDPHHSGIYESLDASWKPVSTIKRAGHILHLLEAVSSMYAITGKAVYRDFLVVCCDVMVTKFYDPNLDCMKEHFTEDWIPYNEITRGNILYGHVLEAAWFLMAIGEKLAVESYKTVGRRLLSFSTRNGWDSVHGGVYYAGKPEGSVVDSTKMWWAQCALIGSLSMAYRQTKDEYYLSWLKATWYFFIEKQFDRDIGEFHMLLHRDGTVYSGLKGKATIDFLPIKAAYHVAQALDCAIRNVELPLADNGQIQHDEIWL